jgi:predicted MFS family arabinose efflux permease
MSSSVAEAQAPASVRLSRGVIALLAVATGLSVANNYYAQPLLGAIRGGLHLSSGAAGLVVTVAQIGYAAGLIFLLPLGDLLQHRRLVVILTAANAAGLAAMASATSAPVLLGASVVVGALSVVAQILVPFAAALASEEERGRVVGTVMSGLLLGILLARTFAGLLSRIGGWPTVYWVAAALMVVLAVALRFGLPAVHTPTSLRYPSLLRSIFTLIREEPVLRLRMVYGGLSFAMFSMLWTSLTFLLSGPVYGYSTSTIGLFGLVGAAGALGANLTGRLADRGAVHRTTAAGLFLILVSWLPVWLGGRSLVALLVGIIVLDLAAQVIHISNQNEIYRIRPEARSRVNSAYMTAYFTGGAIGSALSSYVFGAFGWAGVCVLGCATGGLAVAVWLATAIASRARTG